MAEIPSTPPRTDGVPHDLVAINSDGSLLASSAGQRIMVWDVGIRKLMSDFEAHRGMVQFLAFSRDNRAILSSSESVRYPMPGRAIPCWCGPGGTRIRFARLREDPTPAKSLRSPGSKGLSIYERSGDLTTEFSAMGNGASADIAYSPDGRYLVLLDNRGLTQVWEAPNVGEGVLRRVQAPGEPLAFSAYGLYRSNSDVASMALSPDGKRVAVGIGRDVESWDAFTGRTISSWTGGHSGRVLSVAYRAKGDMVASGGQDKTICVWSRDRAAELRLEGHEGGVTALAYSPDGTQLASGSEDRTVRFWDSTTGKLVRKLEFEGTIPSLVYSPDGRVLAVAQIPVPRGPAPAIPAYEPPGLKRIDTVTGALLPGLGSIPEVARAAAFSKDGSRIVTAPGGDGSVTIWDSSSGKAQKRLPRVVGVAARAMAFTPDRTRLAISYGDNVLSIWRADTAEFIVELDRKPALQLQFSPDGSRLYANGHDAIRVYDTRAAVPAEAEELVRSLRQRFPLYCDVRQFLERETQLDPALREAALRMIEGSAEDARVVHDLIEKVLGSPGGSERLPGGAPKDTSNRRGTAMGCGICRPGWGQPKTAPVITAERSPRCNGGGRGRGRRRSPDYVLFVNGVFPFRKSEASQRTPGARPR